MTAVIGRILGAILRSLFVSVVMFIIAFSVISREFPPNFLRLAKTYQSLQQMTQLNRQIQAPENSVIRQNSLQEDSIERDVEALEQMNLKRVQLGESILSADRSSFVTRLKNTSTQALEENDLKERIAELQTQVYRLQQRVSELENKVK